MGDYSAPGNVQGILSMLPLVLTAFSEVDILISSSLNFREVKYLILDHTGTKWQERDLKEDSMIPKSVLFLGYFRIYVPPE